MRTSDRRRSEEELLVEGASDTPAPGWTGGFSSELAHADPRARAAVLAQAQQGAGNASVAAMLARSPSGTEAPPLPEEESPLKVSDDVEHEVDPHGPGEDGGTEETLEEAEREKGTEDEDGVDVGAAVAEIASGIAEAAESGAQATDPWDGPRADAGPATLVGSVGRGGQNDPADVAAVAAKLRAVGMLEGDAADPEAVGAAIARYQSEVLGWRRADGRVDPGGKTLGALNAGRTAAEEPPAAAPDKPSAAPDGPAPAQQRPSPAPADTPKPRATGAAADVQKWLDEQPTTNPDIATWLLAAAKHGFATFWRSAQLTAIATGKPILNISVAKHKDEDLGIKAGAADKVLGLLVTLQSVIRARAQRWVADPSAPKNPITIGDMARQLHLAKMGDAHADGSSIDVAHLGNAGMTTVGEGKKAKRVYDWTSAGAAEDVVETLRDLPKGKWGIGLPYQGEFFDLKDSLISRQNAAVREAGPGGTPADVTTPSLEMFTGHEYTSKWVGGKWVKKTVRYGVAVEHIRNAELRTAMQSMPGKTWVLFPDAPNHMHITRLG